MPPTRNDLIDWLSNNKQEVKLAINGLLEHEPYCSQDTYRFAFQGGMSFGGVTYPFRGNLHHNGSLGSVWLQGVEGSVNRQDNPASDIIQKRFRILAGYWFGATFSTNDNQGLGSRFAEARTSTSTSTSNTNDIGDKLGAWRNRTSSRKG